MPGGSVVAIGGGTGLPVVLRAVKEAASKVAAVVTMADDGGSSGRLRREFGMLPPGDARNCLVALAPRDSLAAQLFQYRFVQGEGLVGHSVGNLLIAALTQMSGDFFSAIKQAEKLVGSIGRVLPSTTASLTLHAEIATGDALSGQWKIARTRGVKRVRIAPADAPAVAETVQAIAEADMIVVGPGSLFTSIMPNLLVGGIADALRHSPARRVLVVNVANQRGETEGFTAACYLYAVAEHLGALPFEYVVVNDPAVVAAKTSMDPACLVAVDEDISVFGPTPIVADVADETNPLHHDPAKLARVLGELA